MSVFRRTREIGVLRAVGTRRRQVRGMVLVESMTLSVVALALAVPLGWLTSVILIRGAAVAVGGAFHYTYPWTMIPVLGLLAVVIAVLAALAAVTARREAGPRDGAALRVASSYGRSTKNGTSCSRGVAKPLAPGLQDVYGTRLTA